MKYGNTRFGKVTPPVTAALYTANNVVGGIQQIGTHGAQNDSGCLKNVGITDNGNQKVALTLLFFRALPTGTYADKGAPAPSAADLGNFLFKVDVATTDWVSLGTKAFATVEVNRAFKGDASGILYVVAVTPGTPTYTSTTDLVFTYGLRCD